MRMGQAIRILSVLSDVTLPGLTRGEIRRRIGAAEDTAIDSRIRELREDRYGAFNVRVDQSGHEWRYHMLARERARAKRFLAAWQDRSAA